MHHLYKRVNGQPLRRPAWYYDTTVQGDGLVDIQSHMVEQAQWWVLGADVGDFTRDVVLDTASRWATPVPPALFHDSTGLDAYPETLQAAVRDGVLQYACNGEIGYRLRGVSVRQRAEWRQREPEGTGDLHRLTIRGSRCNVHIRQGEETGYKATLHLEPAAGVALEPCCGLCWPSGRRISRGRGRTLRSWGASAATTGTRSWARKSFRAGA